MYKEVFCEIIDDIIRKHHGNKDTNILIYHSNGIRLETSYQYLVFEDNYLKILKIVKEEPRRYDNLYCYIMYSAISAVCSDEI